MELCTGEEVSSYCDSRKLNIRQRLNLVEQICHAVQHASEGHHPPRPQAEQCSGGHARRQAACESHRLRHCQGDQPDADPADAFTESQQPIGTPEHMSPSRRPTRCRHANGCVLARRPALRVAHGINAVQCEGPAFCGVRRTAADHPRGRSAIPARLSHSTETLPEQRGAVTSSRRA